jgi:hypothetical protein
VLRAAASESFFKLVVRPFMPMTSITVSGATAVQAVDRGRVADTATGELIDGL